MKLFRVVAVLALCAGLLLSATSCGVMVHGDNRNHKGWNISSTNTHHSYSINAGKSKWNS